MVVLREVTIRHMYDILSHFQPWFKTRYTLKKRRTNAETLSEILEAVSVHAKSRLDAASNVLLWSSLGA